MAIVVEVFEMGLDGPKSISPLPKVSGVVFAGDDPEVCEERESYPTLPKRAR
jgi:hypothetical protein